MKKCKLFTASNFLLSHFASGIKSLFLLLLIFLFSNQASGQAPNWLWAKSAGGGVDYDEGEDIAVDGNGNSYVTGHFNGDSISLGGTTLINNVGGAFFYDVFVVKYDPAGNVLWAKGAGGTQHDIGHSIAVDGSGNSYVAGRFNSSIINFGSITLTNSSGNWNLFVVKYDPSGNVLWAKTAEGTGYDACRSIAVDSNGNSYVTGVFHSPSISFGSTTLTNVGPNNTDIFVVKYDPSGNVLWANGAGGALIEEFPSIAVDGSGNNYVTGVFSSSSVDFGNVTLTHSTSGFADFFLVKYDASGNVLWAKNTGGIGNDFVQLLAGIAIAVDGSGNSYLTGPFTASSISFGSTTLTNTGNRDFFVVKYDSSGTVLWAKGAGGTGIEDGYGIAVDGSGNSYVIGQFSSDSISFGTTTLTYAGNGDIYVVNYDSSGNVLWATSVGGTGGDAGFGIVVDGNRKSYITGSFSDSVRFGSTTLTKAGLPGLFVAKLDVGPNSIEVVAESGAWKAYPNPVKDILYFTSNRNKTRPGLVQIYDCTGRKVLEEIIDGKQAEIDMRHLPAGLYWMKLGAEGVKVMKE